MKPTIIIAEAGVNHNGDLNKAKELIEISKKCGADIVKFQTFSAEELTTKYAEKADYQKISKDKFESQREMLRNLELNESDHHELINHCKKYKIDFLTTAFDSKSIDFILNLNLKYIKIPSGEITNLLYLRKISSYKKPIFLSTGMSTLEEVGTALKILLKSGVPKDLITILHCTSEYPAPFKDVNLNAMINIGKKYNVKFGYSDHTLGIEVSTAAVALGASVIEKHITLNKNLIGPDHKASLEPDEFHELVKSIRNIEKALGNGIKKPTNNELKTLLKVRQSLVAAHEIKKGEEFTNENIKSKRPGTGISPMLIDKVIGRNAKKDFNKDEQIIL